MSDFDLFSMHTWVRVVETPEPENASRWTVRACVMSCTGSQAAETHADNSRRFLQSRRFVPVCRAAGKAFAELSNGFCRDGAAHANLCA